MNNSIFLSLTEQLKIRLKEFPLQINGLIILAVTVFILVIDLQLPLGVAAGAPYALVIFGSLWVSGVVFTQLIAVLALFFTVIGYWLSPGIAAPMETVLINRGLTLLLIVCTTIMVIKIKRTNIDLSVVLTYSLIDAVSGCKNKHAFEIELDTEILRCQRYNRDLAIAIIDLDDFKTVSTHHDAKYTDEVIRKVSCGIGTGIRTSDILYRIDVDTFAILFPETDLSEAKVICDLIRRKIPNRMKEYTADRITLSAGVVMFAKTDTRTTLCERAMDALIISKTNGRNLVTTLPQVSGKEKSSVAAILLR